MVLIKLLPNLFIPYHCCLFAGKEVLRKRAIKSMNVASETSGVSPIESVESTEAV
jgi:hypothetical protein